MKNHKKVCTCSYCKSKFGKDNYAFIDGRTLKDYLCKDCGKPISITSALYGSHQCKRCNRLGKHLTEVTKKKISEKESGKNHHYFGKKLSQSHKDKISKSHLDLHLTGFWTGKKLSDDHKSKLSVSHGGTGIPYENKDYDRSIFTQELKEEIRDRDNHICQNCGMTEEEHLIVLGYVLTVHHIDYDKDNCSKENLLTLCSNCNIRANYNRDYWKTFYQQKVKIS